MKSEAVYISRRSASVATYLRQPYSGEFRQATANHETTDDMQEPYRSWFLDITKIPEDARAQYLDVNSGEMVTREIPYNI